VTWHLLCLHGSCHTSVHDQFSSECCETQGFQRVYVCWKTWVFSTCWNYPLEMEDKCICFARLLQTTGAETLKHVLNRSLSQIMFGTQTDCGSGTVHTDSTCCQHVIVNLTDTTDWLMSWLSCGITSYSTQNRSFRRRSPIKLNLTQQKHIHQPKRCTITKNKPKN